MPRPLRSTAVAIVAVSLAVSAGAAVAGAQTGGKDAAKRIAAAVDRTTAAGSAKVSINMDVNAKDSSGFVQMDGVVDLERQLGTFTMAISGVGGDAPAIEYRVIGRDLYMNFSGIPEVSAQLPSGKQWVKLRPRELGRDFGTRGTGPGSNDPSLTLKSLRGVSGSVTVVGPDDARGVPATRYKASVDPKKAIKEFPKKDRQKIERQLEVFGGRPFPLEIWIDDQGRAVRIQYHFDAERGDERANIFIRQDFFDFGSPVDVQVPPRGEVVDFKDAFPNRKGTPIYY